MACFLLSSRRLLPLAGTLRSPAARSSKTVLLDAGGVCAFVPSRSYITEMRRSAFKENLLRLLRAEIASRAEPLPPSVPELFGPFSVDERRGKQWIQLRRSLGDEELKIDVTMFDGVAPSSKTAAEPDDADRQTRLRISLMVEVSKGGGSECVLQFACSAWPDALDIEKVFPVRPGMSVLRPYMGPDFKDLDEELQDAAREYLEERGVDEELAAFLHGYMENKSMTEPVHWLRDVKAYVKRK